MSDNILKTIQTILQDVIAPDIREMKARQAAMQQEMNLRFDAMQQQIDTRFKEVDTRFKAMEQQIELQVGSLNIQMGHLEKQLLSAFAASQLQTELNGAKMVVDLRERVAVLESQRAA